MVINPMQDGCIMDWEAMERIFDYIFGQGLKIGKRKTRGSNYADVKGKGKEDVAMEGEGDGFIGNGNQAMEGDDWGLSENPLLVTEPSWITKEGKERMIEIAMEQWNCPAYYAVDKAVLTS
jgi:actin-related protein 4